MIKIAFRYLLYRLFAPHRKGFGVHSPFVFFLVNEVLIKKDNQHLLEINAWRNNIVKDDSIVVTVDTGAGSKVHSGLKRSVGRIAKKSSIRHKYGRVLYKLVSEFKPLTVIELGTGIGISTAYLSKAFEQAQVISIENDESKINIAAKELAKLNQENIVIKEGEFSEVLPSVMNALKHPLLFFIDGDHSYKASIEYFSMIKKVANPDTIIVFDDIRWSEDMEAAWMKIKQDESIRVSIDLFFMGIVFFREGIPKQEFIINF